MMEKVGRSGSRMNKAYREVWDGENRNPPYPSSQERGQGGMIYCPRLPRAGRRKEAVKEGPYLANPSLAARARIVS